MRLHDPESRGMKRYGLSFIFALALGATAAAQTAPQNADRAYTLVGTWSCESMAHSVGTMTFTQNPDGSLSMKNMFQFPNGTPAEIDETYHFDAAANVWKWSLSQPSGPEFRQDGTAPPWTAEKWLFSGSVFQVAVPPPGSIQPPRTSKQPLRMIYTDLNATALRREFEVVRAGRWVTYSGSTCKKLAP